MSEYKAIPPEKLTLAHYDTGGWRASSVERAVYRYAAARPNHIFATAHLEGNTFTLPEVTSPLQNRRDVQKNYTRSLAGGNFFRTYS